MLCSRPPIEARGAAGAGTGELVPALLHPGPGALDLGCAGVPLPQEWLWGKWAAEDRVHGGAGPGVYVHHAGGAVPDERWGDSTVKKEPWYRQLCEV